MKRTTILGLLFLLAAGTASLGQATLPAFHSGPWTNASLPMGWSQSGLGADYGGNYDSVDGNAARLDSSGDWIQIYFSGTPATVSYWAMVNGAFGTSTFKVQQSANGSAWTDVYTFNDTNPVPTTATQYEHFLLSGSRYVRIIYTTKVSGNVGIDGVRIDGLSAPTVAFTPSGAQSAPVSNILSLALSVTPPGSGVQSWGWVPTNFAGQAILTNGVFEITPAAGDLGDAFFLSVVATNTMGASTGSIEIVVTAYQPPMPWVIFSPAAPYRVMASETQRLGIAVRPEGGGIQGWTLLPSNYAGTASRSGTNFTFASASTDGPTNYVLSIFATNAFGVRTGTASIAVTAFAPPPPAGSYTASFDDGTKAGYASGNVTLSNKVWNLTGVLIGSDITDKKIGTKAARLQFNPEDGEETMTIQEKVLSNGIGRVSLWYGPFAEHGSDAPVLALEISDNLSAGWLEVGEVNAGAVEFLTYAVFDVYVREPVYFRIRGKSGESGRSANIDNVTITPYASPASTPYEQYLRQYNVTPGDAGTAEGEDWDGDGATNLQEFNTVPKTNPYDAASVP